MRLSTSILSLCLLFAPLSTSAAPLDHEDRPSVTFGDWLQGNTRILPDDRPSVTFGDWLQGNTRELPEDRPSVTFGDWLQGNTRTLLLLIFGIEA